MYIVEKSQELRIDEIGKKYPKQWVTVDITQKDMYGFPKKGKVLIQANSMDDLMVNEIKSLQGDLYTFYTGSIDDDAE